MQHTGLARPIADARNFRIVPDDGIRKSAELSRAKRRRRLPRWFVDHENTHRIEAHDELGVGLGHRGRIGRGDFAFGNRDRLACCNRGTFRAVSPIDAHVPGIDRAFDPRDGQTRNELRRRFVEARAIELGGHDVPVFVFRHFTRRVPNWRARAVRSVRRRPKR